MSVDDVLDDSRATLADRLPELLSRPLVREALFLASPHLESGLDAWFADPAPVTDRDLTLSLARYVLRMATRPTPFGLFASHASGVIGPDNTTELALGPLHTYRRRTRPDADLLFGVLTTALGPRVPEDVLLQLSSASYRAGVRLRYVAVESTAPTATTAKRHQHRLASVAIDDRLQAVLGALGTGPRSRRDVERAVCEAGHDADHAAGFVEALLRAQVLVPAVGLPLTGDPPVHAVLALLDSEPAWHRLASMLRVLDAALSEFDAAGAVTPDRYRALARSLAELDRGPTEDDGGTARHPGAATSPPPPVDLSLLAQIDLIAPGHGLRLGKAVTDEILKAAQLAWRIGRVRRNPDLVQFEQTMQDRHESEWRPLLEVLDPDQGIGFGRSRAHEPLLADFAFGGADSDSRWTAADDRLLGLVLSAAHTGRTEIELDDDLLTALPTHDRPLPDCFAASVTIAASSCDAIDAGRYEILVNGISGPSGAEMVGRFCHADPELAERTRAHLRAEAALHPDVLFAELTHLPYPRAANILFRPNLREWELPYLSVSGLPVDRQLRVDDLDVAVRHGRVVLRSRAHGREVRPRLSSAQNYLQFGAPLYRFLCCVQDDSQDVAGGWAWGRLGNAPFLPRVQRGRVILSLARWVVRREDVGQGGRGGPRRPVGVDEVDLLRERRGLPRYVVLRDGDNRLVVDLEDAIGKRNLAQALSNRPSVTLEELAPSTGQMCVTREGRPLAHEIVVPFIANVAADASSRRAVRADAGSLRSEPPVDTRPRRAVHLPGSEWLCAHLYGSPRDADAHLADSIARLTDELVSGGLVDRWFFIRYADPEHHLRVRWHRTPEDLSGHARPIVEATIARAYEEGRLSRVSFDSYAPEIDRYGGADAMPSIEELFWHDSVAVSTLLRDSSTRAPARRWQWTLLGMDRMLADIGSGLAERAALARRVRARFAAEFRVNKRLEQQLSTHFRSHRRDLERLVAGGAADSAERRALEVFDLRTANATEAMVDLVRREAVGVLSTPLEVIAESLLHMHANRMLTTSARRQELVLYDHLDRIYRSALARSSVGSS